MTDFKKEAIGEVAFKLIQAKVMVEHKDYEGAKKLVEEIKTKVENMKGFDENLLLKVLQKLEELINDSIRV